MKKYLFLIEHDVPGYSNFILLLDPSDIKVHNEIDFSGKIFIINDDIERDIGMKIMCSIIGSNWDEEDRFISDNGYFLLRDYKDIDIINVMEFPDDDSAILWFKLEYGG